MTLVIQLQSPLTAVSRVLNGNWEADNPWLVSLTYVFSDCACFELTKNSSFSGEDKVEKFVLALTYGYIIKRKYHHWLWIINLQVNKVNDDSSKVNGMISNASVTEKFNGGKLWHQFSFFNISES